MSDFKIENYLVTISIPMRNPIILIERMDILETASFLVRYKENDSLCHDELIELDRARALVEFAILSGAELYAMEWKSGFMKFSFKFLLKENQEYFLNNFKESVENGTMK